MAIRFIQYTPQQTRGMAITAYSLYVNGSYWQMFETIASLLEEAKHYIRANDIEVYPVLKRRY